MTRWYSSGGVDLKSQKFVDVSLDSIVAAMKIPRDVGKPPWSRNNNNNNNNYRGGGGGGGRNEYRGRSDYGGGGNYYNNNYSRRYYEPPAPRVKRLRDDRYQSRPRGWNHWSQTGGMYSDRRNGGRDWYGSGGGWGGGGSSYGRAPRYSSWYNRRNRYNDGEEDDWVDEDGSFYGDHWNGNNNRRGNDRYNGSRYGNDSKSGGYNGSRYGNDSKSGGYNRNNRSQPRQQSAFGSRSSRAVNGSERMDTTESRSKGAISSSSNNNTQPSTPSHHKVLHWPTLLISNLNPAVTDLDIYDLFQEFGNLKRANVHHDKYGNSLQTADVVFFSEEDARRALREYDNTPLDGCVMRIFLCNSFSGTSVSSITSQAASEDRHSRHGKSGGGGEKLERGGGDADPKVSSSSSRRQGDARSENPTSLFKVNDISKLDSNKNFVSNFSDELKHQSTKPRIPIKQGKWWQQQSRNGNY